MSKNIEIIQKLHGHSGCKIDLCKGVIGYFIRKTSPNETYDQRLIKQASKQYRLSATIPVPKILLSTFDASPAAYEMEFIQGMDFRQACFSRPMSWMTRFVKILVTHLQKLEETTIKADLSQRFRSKISQLGDAIVYHESEVVRSLSAQISKLAERDYSLLPATECHGDLTLENIIFKGDGDIVFIDVLDGDLETFWMDLAKLLFDVEISWSLRSSLWRTHHTADDRFLSMIGRYLGDELRLAISEHFPDAVTHLEALKAIQALRIIPYSHDEQTVSKLAGYIASLKL